MSYFLFLIKYNMKLSVNSIDTWFDKKLFSQKSSKLGNLFPKMQIWDFSIPESEKKGETFLQFFRPPGRILMIKVTAHYVPLFFNVSM